MEQLLEINDLHCGYNGKAVVNGVSFSIAPGTINCLLGPSGCGKTTVLRAIAGFEKVTAGEINLDGLCVSSTDRIVPPEKRGVGMVFQDYALFPHLDIENNIRFGLKNESGSEQTSRVKELLELVGLEGYGKQYPHELSGGQQQRIALARALAPKPGLLLMDEPFSNLDVDLRERLAVDVREILKSQGTAALFVTHDQHEAFVMGEKIGVMNNGRILQWDSPFNLYHEPADRFVADFIGQGRFLGGHLVAPDRVETAIGPISGNRAYRWPTGSRVEILLRPDDVLLVEEGGMKCEIIDRSFRGAETLFTLRLPTGEELLSLMPSRYDYTIGQEIGALVDLDHLVLFQE